MVSKTGYIKVPNLEKWQHYKDRCPPWIKLHRDILNDYKYSCLQDASKLHLLMIWLLASQMDNKIPADEEWIAKRINATNSIKLKELISHGFLEYDSATIAGCKQVDIVETETETEKDLCNFEEKFDLFWKDYPRKTDKKKAKAKFFKLNLHNGKFETIMNALQQQKESEQWTKDKGKFVPHPTTWINGERWDDEMEAETGEWK